MTLPLTSVALYHSHTPGHAMTSPLTSVALFHLGLGAVPVTAGVLVTWAIMAVLVLGGIVITGRLSLAPSAAQAAFELIVDTVDSQIRDTMRVEPAPYRAFIGTLFVFIFVANWSSLIPGVCAADGPRRDRRRAGAHCLHRGDLVRHPRGRCARLSHDLCVAQPNHDSAQFRRNPHAHLLAARPSVRQRDERGLRDRHRAVARRALRADPADGARSPDRCRAGLYLRRLGDGLHCRRGQRRKTRTSSQRTPQ